MQNPVVCLRVCFFNHRHSLHQIQTMVPRDPTVSVPSHPFSLTRKYHFCCPRSRGSNSCIPSYFFVFEVLLLADSSAKTYDAHQPLCVYHRLLTQSLPYLQYGVRLTLRSYILRLFFLFSYIMIYSECTFRSSPYEFRDCRYQYSLPCSLEITTGQTLSGSLIKAIYNRCTVFPEYDETGMVLPNCSNGISQFTVPESCGGSGACRKEAVGCACAVDWKT